MPMYRTYMRRADTPPTDWDWVQTAFAPSSAALVDRAYEAWEAHHANPQAASAGHAPDRQSGLSDGTRSSHHAGSS